MSERTVAVTLVIRTDRPAHLVARDVEVAARLDLEYDIVDDSFEERDPAPASLTPKGTINATTTMAKEKA